MGILIKPAHLTTLLIRVARIGTPASGDQRSTRLITVVGTECALWEPRGISLVEGDLRGSSEVTTMLRFQEPLTPAAKFLVGYSLEAAADDLLDLYDDEGWRASFA